YSGVTLILSAVSFGANLVFDDSTGVVSIIGMLVSLAVSAVITIAYAKMALSARSDNHVSWRELWAPEHFLNVLGTTILQGIIIFVGLLLLVIPGIVAALMLSMSQLSAVDQKLNPVAALKESYRLTKGHVFQLFLLALIAIGINVIGALA